MCPPIVLPIAAEPNWVVIPVRLTKPSGFGWRVPNFDIRNRL